MGKKINNEKEYLPIGEKLNDLDILTDLLNTFKNINQNLAIALNEASNRFIYKEYIEINNRISELQRNIFELLFEKGWYSIETAIESKIFQTKNNLMTLSEELKK